MINRTNDLPRVLYGPVDLKELASASGSDGGGFGPLVAYGMPLVAVTHLDQLSSMDLCPGLLIVDVARLEEASIKTAMPGTFVVDGANLRNSLLTWYTRTGNLAQNRRRVAESLDRYWSERTLKMHADELENENQRLLRRL